MSAALLHGLVCRRIRTCSADPRASPRTSSPLYKWWVVVFSSGFNRVPKGPDELLDALGFRPTRCYAYLVPMIGRGAQPSGRRPTAPMPRRGLQATRCQPRSSCSWCCWTSASPRSSRRPCGSTSSPSCTALPEVRTRATRAGMSTQTLICCVAQRGTPLLWAVCGGNARRRPGVLIAPGADPWQQYMHAYAASYRSIALVTPRRRREASTCTRGPRRRRSAGIAAYAADGQQRSLPQSGGFRPRHDRPFPHVRLYYHPHSMKCTLHHKGSKQYRHSTSNGWPGCV